MLKRIFDFCFSLIALIVLLPLFIIIGIIIKLDSSGPVFYLQERVGIAGRLFKLIKFRTMQTDADRNTAITVGNRDPRITKFGYYLRKYKVDELPQFINVLKNDMSLVGPRPELKKFVDLYDSRQRQVIEVKPGITDFASIMFRDENEMLEGKEDPIAYYIDKIMPAKLDLNLKYIKEQSFLIDLRIIFNTILSIFRGS